jgi:alkaline phosphatase
MQNQFGRRGIAAVAVAIFVLACHGRLSPSDAAAPASSAPKYIFLFLVDGGGITHMEITRQYNRVVHNEGLIITDSIMKEGTLGLLATDPANSLSTDSAAAATALASGCKAKLGMLGMCADGTVPTTAMEIAKEKGMRIGLVTNGTVYDASPAAFLCQVPSRRQYAAILNCYLKKQPDLLLGGGRNQFVAKGQAESRVGDEIDLTAAFVNKGYAKVETKTELEQVRGGRVLGLFSPADMSFEIDRDTRTEPALYEMTQAAIRLLHANDQRGFFLFIENENVDTAAHQSDIAAVVRDFREFDRAVGLAYDFYKKYPRDTLIIVTSDHETGGIGFTLALKDLTSTKGANQAAGTTEDLKKIHSIPISLKKVAEILGPRPTGAAVDAVMKEYFKGFTLAPEFKEAILKQQPISRTLFTDATMNALGMMIANNTQAYWLTSTHTNQPVFVAALGEGSERFRGYQDNSDLGKNLKAILENIKKPAH